MSVTRSRRASCLGSHASLTIFNLEPLDLQIVASPSNQVILAEPSISRLLEYKFTLSCLQTSQPYQANYFFY
ncbi:hypothetical protein BSZ04_00115 [Vibrio rotiferianus]|nr:hypothetical protein BSZ04_00115 [Vibrio rotiferianus]